MRSRWSNAYPIADRQHAMGAHQAVRASTNSMAGGDLLDGEELPQRILRDVGFDLRHRQAICRAPELRAALRRYRCKTALHVRINTAIFGLGYKFDWPALFGLPLPLPVGIRAARPFALPEPIETPCLSGKRAGLLLTRRRQIIISKLIIFEAYWRPSLCPPCPWT